MNNFIVTNIDASLTWPLRHKYLRNKQPLENSKYSGDELPTTLHVGGYLNTNLVTVVSVFQEAHPNFSNSKNTFRIRGMVTIDSARKKGFGEACVKYAEKIIFGSDVKADLIWMNARIGAKDFYKKLGYKITGNEFSIEDIGLHLVMYKTN